jgi:hypothetical protein
MWNQERVIWQLDVGDWHELSDPTRESCSALVVEYGGAVDEGCGRFRRYRAAELCVHSLREIGVRSDIHLAGTV